MSNYAAYASAAIEALQDWYNPSTGLWESTGWWNAANALHAVIDYSMLTGTNRYHPVIETTFRKHHTDSFLNEYYDDEGWWALSWIGAYDLLGQRRYLTMAQAIFADMARGWDTVCGGGIWWSKQRTYKNAIANSLFLLVAARLARRVGRLGGGRGRAEGGRPRTSGPFGRPDGRSYGGRNGGAYGEWAWRSWNWFAQSGMLNEQHLVNDGLDAACRDNGQTTWTYNQGVLIGGLAELSFLTNEVALLDTAEAIASAVIHTLVDEQGILREPCEFGDCGNDGPQFKGIFMRHLAELHAVRPRELYKAFILRNADALWSNNRTPLNQFGLRWSGSVDAVDAARQSSALDALNAAIPFSS